MIDIYNQPAKTVTVLCHTSLGDPSDKQGRFFVKGNEYKLNTEITTPYRLSNGLITLFALYKEKEIINLN